MTIFLHNRRCWKSNEALKLMSDSRKNYTLREYIKNPLDFHELQDLQELLWIKAIELTRTDEKEFIDSGLTKESSDIEILKLMAKNPKIMQRPIVFDDVKAVICRPPSDIVKFFRR